MKKIFRQQLKKETAAQADDNKTGLNKISVLLRNFVNYC